MDEPTKQCTRCAAVKPLTEFHKHSKGLLGRRSRCKACVCEHARQYRAANQEAVREYHAEPVVNPMRTKHGPWYREHGRIPTRDEVAAAMGIDWMRGEEIKQAIPPAYSEFIGSQMLEALAV